MEQFTFSRQTTVFLTVIAILAIVLAVGLPIGSVLLGAIAAPVVVIMWAKAGIRGQRWFWWNIRAAGLTQSEGAAMLSGWLLLCIGVIVLVGMGIKLEQGRDVSLTGFSWPIWEARTPVLGGNVHYSDPAMQQQLKDALAKAGIPFTTDTTGGREFIHWSDENNAAVEMIQGKMYSSITPSGVIANGHNIRYEDPKQQREFKDWLEKNAIPYKTTTMAGSEFVEWDASVDAKVRAYTEAPCKRPMATNSSKALDQSKC